MANIPQKKLSEKQYKNITGLLGKVFTFTNNRSVILSLFQELFTKNEYEALLRRLTAILMLDYGDSYYAINKSLGLSIRTLRILDKRMKNGDLVHVINVLHKIVNYIPNNIDRTRAGFEKKNSKNKRTINGKGTQRGGILPYYGESVNSYMRRTSGK